MKKMKFNRILAIVGLLFVGAVGCFAQHAVVVGGGSVGNEKGSMTYTIGQVVSTVASTKDYSLVSVPLSGAIQIEVSVATAIEETEFIDLNVAVHPNPVVNMLTLSLATDDLSGFDAKVFDLSGHTVASVQVVSQDTQIDVSDLAKGTYIVAVSRNGKEMKTFKIIKK